MLDYHDIHIMLCQYSLPSHLVIKRSSEVRMRTHANPLFTSRPLGSVNWDPSSQSSVCGSVPQSFLMPEVVELMKLKFSVYIYTMGPMEQAHKKYRQHDYRGYGRLHRSSWYVRITGVSHELLISTVPRSHLCTACVIS
jgi:hypothetical protein